MQSKCLGEIQFGITCRSDVVWLKDSRAKSVYKLFGSRFMVSFLELKTAESHRLLAVCLVTL